MNNDNNKSEFEKVIKSFVILPKTREEDYAIQRESQAILFPDGNGNGTMLFKRLYQIGKEEMDKRNITDEVVFYNQLQEEYKEFIQAYQYTPNLSQ